jgi:hypothetical protein
MEIIENTALMGFTKEGISHAITFFKSVEEAEHIEDMQERLRALSSLEQKELDPDLSQYAHDRWRKHMDNKYKRPIQIACVQKDLHTIEKLYDEMEMTHQFGHLLPKVQKYYRTAFKFFLQEASVEQLMDVIKRQPRIELANHSMRARLLKRVFQRSGYL